MKGRTMYVVPFSMGPLGSDIAHIGVQLTDSAYVAVSMRIMTRMGTGALEVLGATASSCPACTPSAPRSRPARQDVAVAVQRREQVHRPLPRDPRDHRRSARATAATRCWARSASRCASPRSWPATPAGWPSTCSSSSSTSPEGETRYITGAFPSACGKTNLAMLIPSIEGWKVETVGDDICWMKFGADGRLYAINPEAGFFGVAPGTNTHTNPNAILTLDGNCIFTNTALTDDGDIWWEGMTDEPPAHLTDWKGNDWTPESGTPAAHPNARFTAPASQDPAIAPEWEDPKGVPISAILFGGRRASVVPLVFQSHDWEHGVFLGSIMASETTAAQAGAVGNLRRDPFAMLPFCGYNMADYFAHWLRIGAEAPDRDALPKIFYVNWFRKDAERQVPLARLRRELTRARVDLQPRHRQGGGRRHADRRGPDARRHRHRPASTSSREQMEELLRVDTEGWRAEVPLIQEYYAKFGDRLPQALADQAETLGQRLG